MVRGSWQELAFFLGFFPRALPGRARYQPGFCPKPGFSGREKKTRFPGQKPGCLKELPFCFCWDESHRAQFEQVPIDLARRAKRDLLLAGREVEVADIHLFVIAPAAGSGDDASQVLTASFDQELVAGALVAAG